MFTSICGERIWCLRRDQTNSWGFEKTKEKALFLVTPPPFFTASLKRNKFSGDLIVMVLLWTNTIILPNWETISKREEIGLVSLFT